MWELAIPSPSGQSTAINLLVSWPEATDKASSQECTNKKLDKMDQEEVPPTSEGDELLKIQDHQASLLQQHNDATREMQTKGEDN